MLRRPLLPLTLIAFMGACTHDAEKNSEALVLDNAATVAPAHDSPILLHRVAFGSCNDQNLPQPMWRKLVEEKPDLWIWTGDAIYADTEDMGALTRMYARQLRQPEYAGFLATKTPIIGTYDDHDFGANDAGKEYSKKLATKKYFLDFINEPQDSPRRNQPGIYTSYRFGPQGKRLKILLTDTRYNRDSPGASSDMLGVEQWTWLEQELSKADAELLVLVSGTQLLPFEHPYEKWADFPQSRQRLLELLGKSSYKNILIISGDRHIGEISKLTLPDGRSLWEVTSSGLTHSYQAFSPAKSPNSLRSGGTLARLNYGILNIEWDGASPHVDMEVRDINRQSILKQTVDLSR